MCELQNTFYYPSVYNWWGQGGGKTPVFEEKNYSLVVTSTRLIIMATSKCLILLGTPLF